MTPLDSIRIALVRGRFELEHVINTMSPERRVPLESTLRDIGAALAAVDMFAACFEAPVSSDLEAMARHATPHAPPATPQPPAPRDDDNGVKVLAPQPPPRKPPPANRVHPAFGAPVNMPAAFDVTL